MASFQALPAEMLYNIFQYLNGKELAQCAMVCVRFFGLEELWKLRCERDWNISQLPQNFTTWKECYVDMYGRFGPYVTCYKRVSKCWEKIFAVTRERSPPIYATLHRDGIDEETLRSGLNLESYDTKVPLEYRCTYRLCNGQTIQNTSRGTSDHFTTNLRPSGLFGASTAFTRCNYMCSYRRGCPDDSIVRRCCCLTFIFISEYVATIKGPLALCVRDAETSPARRNCQQDASHEGLNGSVVSMRLRSNEWFIYGNSFIEFLEDFANCITRCPVATTVPSFLMFNFNAECTSGPFTFTVQTMFDRVGSKAFPVEVREFNFWYQVTMRMHPDASQSDSCRLETNHWIISDNDGRVEAVEGPGFVKNFPVMRPGVEFTWKAHTNRSHSPWSGPSSSTPSRKMTGYFTMRKLNTDGEITASVEFHLVAPTYVRAI